MEQRSLALKADTTWVHVFTSMVKNGDLARLKPFAVTVYLTVKAHTNFDNGEAFPSIETISRLSGISIRQVKMSLRALEEAGYLVTERKGRSNLYHLREKVQITDANGQPHAIATWNYLPLAVEGTRAQLRRLLLQGQLNDDATGEGGTKGGKREAAASLILIENLNVQVVTGGTGVQVNVHLGRDGK